MGFLAPVLAVAVPDIKGELGSIDPLEHVLAVVE